MTEWLADATLAHLRDVAEWPDLGPRYEITGRLGRGGMGVVFSAHDRTLTRDVAVKVLDDAGRDEDLSRRLLGEAQILATLEHPGIVPVHDAGTLPDGRVFYVMKLVRGARLGEALPSDASLGERIDLVLRICDAVSFAHARGIVHRDLKPENVMVGSFGEVLVMDWGVASVLADALKHEGHEGEHEGHEEEHEGHEGHEGHEEDVTARAPLVVGTPGFMAPEQASGAPDHVDARADVYALGALLAAVVPPPVPRRLAAIAARARAERPDDRYPTVDAFAKDLVNLRDGEPVEAYRETFAERLARVYQRYRVPILLVLAYMIMRVMLLLWVRI